MALPNGDLITTPFDPQMAYPSDRRMQVDTLNSRDSISMFIRWEGMTVYVLEDSKIYILQGGRSNEYWKELGTGTGTGGTTFVGQFPTADLLPTSGRSAGDYAFVGTGDDFVQYNWDNIANEWVMAEGQTDMASEFFHIGYKTPLRRPVIFPLFPKDVLVETSGDFVFAPETAVARFIFTGEVTAIRGIETAAADREIKLVNRTGSDIPLRDKASGIPYGSGFDFGGTDYTWVNGSEITLKGNGTYWELAPNNQVAFSDHLDSVNAQVSVGSDGLEIITGVYDRYTGQQVIFKEINYTPESIDGVVFMTYKDMIFARAEYIATGVVLAAWFGALGYGLDYSSQVQLAINSTPDRSTLKLSRGQYKLAELTSNKSIKIIGDQAEIIGIKQFEGYGPIKNIFTSVASGVDILIQGISVLGGAETPTYHPSQTMDYVFLIENANSIVFRDCYLNGITLRPGTSGMTSLLKERRYSIITCLNCNRIEYINNKHEKIGYFEQTWFVPSEGGSFLIDGNEVIDNMLDPSFSATWSLTAFTVIDGRGIFRNNTIKDIHQSACNLLVYDSIIENNTIENVRNSAGIDLTESGIYVGDNNIIRDNKIRDVGTYGIGCAGSNVTIQSNTIYNAKMDGIRLIPNSKSTNSVFGDFAYTSPVSISNIVIDDNKIYECGESGLNLGNRGDGLAPFSDQYVLDDLTITNNTIITNGVIQDMMNTILLTNVSNFLINNNTLINSNSTKLGRGIAFVNTAKNGEIKDNTISAARGATAGRTVLVSSPFNNNAYLNINITDNYFNAGSTLEIYKLSGISKIKNNHNIDYSSIRTYGRPIAFHFEKENNLKKLERTSLPTDGVYNVGDKIFRETIPFGGTIASFVGWVCITSGGAFKALRSGSTQGTFNTFLKYSDGSIWEALNFGALAGTEPDISGATIGDTITDGAVQMVKVANQEAVFMPFGQINEDFGLRTVGTTAQRPTPARRGFEYYDLTLASFIKWNGSEWVTNYPPNSSTTERGIIEQATDAEIKTGTDTERAVDPKGLKDNYISYSDRTITSSGTIAITPLTYNVRQETIIFTGTAPITLNGFNDAVSNRNLILVNQTGGTITIPASAGVTVPFAAATTIGDGEASRFMVYNNLILKEV